MRQRTLIWLAPAVALAAAVAYVATAPRPSNEAEVREAPLEAFVRADTAATRRAAAGGTRATGGSAAEPRREAADCTMVTRYLEGADGTPIEVYTCVPFAEEEKHPYESYSNDALASLAYADAKAAEILGMRLREEDEEAAMSLIFRATALSGGDAGPILAFSNAYPHPSSIDGVPVRRTVHRKFVMSAVAELLGAERNGREYWETRVREASPDAERDLALLRAQAQKIFDEMRQIQLDVTGSASIGGANDA